MQTIFIVIILSFSLKIRRHAPPFLSLWEPRLRPVCHCIPTSTRRFAAQYSKRRHTNERDQCCCWSCEGCKLCRPKFLIFIILKTGYYVSTIDHSRAYWNCQLYTLVCNVKISIGTIATDHLSVKTQTSMQHPCANVMMAVPMQCRHKEPPQPRSSTHACLLRCRR